MVIDGHGGRNAVDYVAENLGKNIVNSLEGKVVSKSFGNHIEDALRQGYSETDRQFLVQVYVVIVQFNCLHCRPIH